MAEPEQISSMATQDRVFRPRYHGETGGIGKIALRNSVLGVLTLGFYRFWAKTRLRRYMWSNLEFDGDRLEYHGQAKELFIGFLIVLAVVLPLVIALNLLQFFVAAETGATLGRAFGLVFLFLFALAAYRARRYQLSRTSWRGIRGNQGGRAVVYAVKSFLLWLAVGFTAGLAWPLRTVVLADYKLNNTWIGSKRFIFEGRASKLFGTWLVAWLLLPPSLGFSYLWYRAAELRYFASCTTFDTLKIQSDIRGRQLAGIYVPYWLVSALAFMVFGTLVTILMFPMMSELAETANQAGQTKAEIEAAARQVTVQPYFLVTNLLLAAILIVFLRFAAIVMVLHRMAGLVCRSFTVVGNQDFESLRQTTADQPRFGEGLADAFDVGDF